MLRAPGAVAHLVDGYSIEIASKDAPMLAVAGLPRGTAVSVTDLSGEEGAHRVTAAAAVREAGFVPVPHFAARRLRSLSELDELLDSLARNARPDQAFVIAGDAVAAVGPFEDSLGLIRSGRFARHAYRIVGIAGHPQGHPQISNEELWAALKDKIAALGEQGIATEIVTQFAFDARIVLDWIAEVRSRGITVPLKVGIPGPASAKTLLRFAARCGVETSAKVMARYGLSLTKLLTKAGPDRLVAELADALDARAHGAVSLHIYPFGGLTQAATWANAACATSQRISA